MIDLAAVEIPKRARPKVRKPAHRCYELCWRTMLDMPDDCGWVLVHGDGPEFLAGHAWLEHGDTIFDSQSGKGMDRAYYERRWKLVAIARYTKLEAATKALETGHMGPW
jgi:hypothetical protein